MNPWRIFIPTLALLLPTTGCNPPSLGNPASNPSKKETAPEKTAAPAQEESLVTAPVDYIAASIKAGNQAKASAQISTLKDSIRSFIAMEGRNPDSLQELVDKGYLMAIPKPPPGRTLAYNPQTGEVSLPSSK